MPSSTMAAAMFVPKTFSNLLSIKLDEKNFLLWQHQVLFTIKANKLQNHLCEAKILKKFASDANEESENELQEYMN